MNRHHAKAKVLQKTRVIGFRITDHEHQKIIEAQQALRSLRWCLKDTKENLMDKKNLKQSKKHVPSFKMPFSPKRGLKGNLKYERKFYLDVSN